MSKQITYTCDGCRKKMTELEIGNKLVVKELYPAQSPEMDGYVNTYHFCSWICLGKRCKREVH